MVKESFSTAEGVLRRMPESVAPLCAGRALSALSAQLGREAAGKKGVEEEEELLKVGVCYHCSISNETNAGKVIKRRI